MSGRPPSGVRSKARIWFTTAARPRLPVPPKSDIRLAKLQAGRSPIEPVELAALARETRRHRAIVRPEDQTFEQGGRRRPRLAGAAPAVLGKNCVDPVPRGAVDQRLMRTGVDRALMRDLADIGRVVEQLINDALVKRPAAPGAVPGGVQLLHKPRSGADLQEAREGTPDERGLGLVHDELPLPREITDWNVTAHPEAPLAGREEFVSDPFSGKPAFVLRKAQNHVQVQPAERRRRIEALGDAHQRDRVAVEDLDQLGEVRQRSAWPKAR